MGKLELGEQGEGKGGWGEASSGEMWFEPAVKGIDGFGAGFARGQRAGPENLQGVKIWYVGDKETACKGSLPP